ncbi:MAG: GNAT family N-acetyltransferase [Cyanobacteria bacterium P01_H01_bin.21]
MEYRILRAQPTDWQQVRSVRLRALADAPDAFGSTFEEEQQLTDKEWRSRSKNLNVAQFLAISPSGHGLGIAVGAPCSEQEQTAGLFSMWVASETRKCRIGIALVKTVIDWAQAEGYRRIILDVGDANTPAIRLYQACGFVLTGRTGSLPPPRDHIRELEMERVFS